MVVSRPVFRWERDFGCVAENSCKKRVFLCFVAQRGTLISMLKQDQRVGFVRRLEIREFGIKPYLFYLNGESVPEYTGAALLSWWQLLRAAPGDALIRFLQCHDKSRQFICDGACGSLIGSTVS
jgi:hypothetical protein